MSRPVRIALATCFALPEPDVDEAPLLGALAREGASVSLLAWDGPSPLPDAGEVDLVVVRSTWNYARDLAPFLSWVDSLAHVVAVKNPPGVLRENVDKSYLRAFAERGIRTVPTAFVDRGATLSLSEVCAARGFVDVVVKPRVSAGSFQTERFARPDAPEAEAFFRSLVEHRDVLVQPYVESVEGRGERSIVVLDGRVSHAVRKSPRFSGDAEVVTRVSVDDDERRFAEAVLAQASYDGLLYARVDTARDADGKLLLMELELLEPSLFFREAPEALPGFARAIVREAMTARSAR